ncbi:nitroreductase family protein [Hyphobacterium marinum]|uniref:Nitroreductase family protein n=1 Tax=Hyphobacterium marinum TaxID=3116574 RepID=A0ABU7LYU5_9PROT|nr:nitroreductase family protein [Hyphobacterium sp. Y6023]MEE2566722.1 nitroreductase family protein [Hyphobacterium sp. Y6023]
MPPKTVPLDFTEKPEDQMRAEALAFYEDIKRRRTVRDFSDRDVPREIVANAIRAAGTAPSGANHQPWHFVAIRPGEIRTKLRAAAEAEEKAFYEGKASQEWLDALEPLGTDDHKPYLETAPWLIAVFAQRRGGVTVGETKKNYYVAESVGIACGMLLTALHRAGLATLTHTPNPMTFLTEICGRPSDEKPYMLIVAGYPAEGASVPEHALVKKSLDDITTWL